MFKPGQSGNPKGRAKGRIELGTYLRDWLKKTVPGPSNLTNLQVLIERLALEDPKVLLHYAFGKPTETHEVSGSVSIDMRLVAAAQKVAKTL